MLTILIILAIVVTIAIAICILASPSSFLLTSLLCSQIQKQKLTFSCVLLSITFLLTFLLCCVIIA